MTYDPLPHNQQTSSTSLALTNLPILDTPTLLPLRASVSPIELLDPTLMAQHSGLSTYVPTNLYTGASFFAFVFPRSATKPSVNPIATSMLSSLRDAVRAPVPVGKGLISASNPKCLIAKCRGVEKCSKAYLVLHLFDPDEGFSNRGYSRYAAFLRSFSHSWQSCGLQSFRSIELFLKTCC